MASLEEGRVLVGGGGSWDGVSGQDMKEAMRAWPAHSSGLDSGEVLVQATPPSDSYLH